MEHLSSHTTIPQKEQRWRRRRWRRRSGCDPIFLRSHITRPDWINEDKCSQVFSFLSTVALSSVAKMCVPKEEERASSSPPNALGFLSLLLASGWRYHLLLGLHHYHHHFECSQEREQGEIEAYLWEITLYSPTKQEEELSSVWSPKHEKDQVSLLSLSVRGKKRFNSLGPSRSTCFLFHPQDLLLRKVQKSWELQDWCCAPLLFPFRVESSFHFGDILLE